MCLSIGCRPHLPPSAPWVRASASEEKYSTPGWISWTNDAGATAKSIVLQCHHDLWQLYGKSRWNLWYYFTIGEWGLYNLCTTTGQFHYGRYVMIYWTNVRITGGYHLGGWCRLTIQGMIQEGCWIWLFFFYGWKVSHKFIGIRFLGVAYPLWNRGWSSAWHSSLKISL